MRFMLMDNTVAEGYWYPDGNKNSLTYIKIQRDTLYWYEFNPEQGDVQVGEAEERLVMTEQK